MSRLELRWNQWHGFGVSFLDYIVDGGSVWSDHRVGHEVNEIPLLGWQPVSADNGAAARLVLEEPPDLGERTAIFVCGSCGDLDCGAFSVVIERDGDDIVWRDRRAGRRTTGSTRPCPDHSTPSGWVRDDGLPLPDDMDKIVGAHTFREGFDAWPAELRFDYREYREAIVNRPPSVSTRR